MVFYYVFSILCSVLLLLFYIILLYYVFGYNIMNPGGPNQPSSKQQHDKKQHEKYQKTNISAYKKEADGKSVPYYLDDGIRTKLLELYKEYGDKGITPDRLDIRILEGGLENNKVREIIVKVKKQSNLKKVCAVNNEDISREQSIDNIGSYRRAD